MADLVDASQGVASEYDDPLRAMIRQKLSRASIQYNQEAEEARDAYTYDYGDTSFYNQGQRRRGRGSTHAYNRYDDRNVFSETRTLTQVLIDSSKPNLLRWMESSGILDIEEDAYLAEQSQQPGEPETPIEDAIEDELPEGHMDLALSDLLLFGMTGFVANSAIKPTLIDPAYTYLSDRCVITSFELTEDEIYDLIGLLIGDSVQHVSPPSLYQGTAGYDNKTAVRYGNVKYHGVWYRFLVDPMDELYVQAVPEPDLNYVVWDRDTNTNHPIGVYGKIRAFEPKWRHRQRKKNKIIHNVLEASLIVKEGMLPEDTKRLYTDEILEIAGAGAEGAMQAEVVPDKRELIEAINNELDLLEAQSRQLTGLIQVNQFDANQTERSATEVSIEFYRSSTALKVVMDRMAILIKGVYMTVARERFGIPITIKLRKNPLELEQEVAEAATLYADVFTMWQADPEGTKLGGVVDGRSLSELLKIRARAAGIDPALFNLNFETATENAEMQQELQETQQQMMFAELQIKTEQASAASHLALAELEKARVNSGKASNEAFERQQKHLLEVHEARAKLFADLRTDDTVNLETEAILGLVDRIIPLPAASRV